MSSAIETRFFSYLPLSNILKKGNMEMCVLVYHCAKYLHEYGLLQYTPFKDSCVFCLRPGHITKKISEYAY